MTKLKHAVLALLICSSSLVSQQRQSVLQEGTKAETALRDLAASMQPGTFALLNQSGDDSGYDASLTDGANSGCTPVGSIFGYAQKAVYDPIADRVYFS